MACPVLLQTSCWSLPLQAFPTCPKCGCPIPPRLSKYALIICCFHPHSPGQETDTKGWLHTEVGPKPKLGPRSGTTKEEE